MKILLCLLSLGCFGLSAQEGFVPLFNGRDLSNWTNVNCAPETWTVRDGMIISTGIPTGVLRTKRQYENFIVELEWKHLKKNGNAGFFVHSGPLPICGQPFTKAIEIQIIDGMGPEGVWTGHGDVFSIQGASFVPDRPHPRGWQRCLPSENRARPAGEWNHYRVECRDGKVKLSVNGKEVSGGSDCRPRKGFLCLESEGSEAHFRNLKIQELPTSNPPADQVAELDAGFASLYTGLDMRGWSGPTNRWQPRDWILQCAAETGGTNAPLWAQVQGKDYQLILDWRFVAKSGTEADGAGVQVGSKSQSRVRISRTMAGSWGGNLENLMPSAQKKEDQWNRFIITRKNDRLTVSLNDREVLREQKIDSEQGPGAFGLRGGGETLQFANIYFKKL